MVDDQHYCRSHAVGAEGQSHALGRRGQSGDAVVDLGSGSGMNNFVAALEARAGRVVGVDITDAQLEKARRLALMDLLRRLG